MPLRDPASWMGGRNHLVDADRHLTAALLGSPAAATPAPAVTPTNVGGGHGVCGDADLAVTAGAAARQVSVAAGHAFVRGATTAAQAVYAVWNDAAATVTVDVGDANPRYDLIAVRLRDSDPGVGNAASDVSFQVVKGTPSPTPTDPALPTGASWLVLARVRIPAGFASGSTINPTWIDDLRPRATALGGVRRVSGALPTQNVSDGEFCWSTSENMLYRFSATLNAWVRAMPSVNGSTNGWPSPAVQGQIAFNPRGGVTLPSFFDGGQWRSLGQGSLRWNFATVLDGTAPPDDVSRVPLIMQAGSHVVQAASPTTGTGDFAVFYPWTFPNGIASVQVTFGDVAQVYVAALNGSGAFAGYYDISRFNLAVYGAARNGFSCRLRGNSGEVVSGAFQFRVHWMAFGW